MVAHVAAAMGDTKAASVLALPLANTHLNHLNGSPRHGKGAVEPEKFVPEKFVRQTPNGMNSMNGAASSPTSTRLFVHPALGQHLLNQPLLQTQLDRMRTLEARTLYMSNIYDNTF
jgi:hypothetical protein